MLSLIISLSVIACVAVFFIWRVPTVRQQYKLAALGGLLAAGKGHNFSCTGDTTLASECGKLADAMLVEDEEHAAK